MADPQEEKPVVPQFYGVQTNPFQQHQAQITAQGFSEQHNQLLRYQTGQPLITDQQNENMINNATQFQTQAWQAPRPTLFPQYYGIQTNPFQQQQGQQTPQGFSEQHNQLLRYQTGQALIPDQQNENMINNATQFQTQACQATYAPHQNLSEGYYNQSGQRRVDPRAIGTHVQPASQCPILVGTGENQQDIPTHIVNTFNIGTVMNSNIVPGDNSHNSVNVRQQKDAVRFPSDVQDIKELLITAYEGIQIISINPVLNNPVNMKNLEDIYTDIVIEEKIEKSARRRNDKQCVKVTSLRQIFDKGDKKIRRIVLKAPAGQGKSTFCLKLVHTWCSVQKKKLKHQKDDIISDKCEINGLKDEDVMCWFDVLLYVSLRDITDEKTLMDVIYAQFPLHESLELSHRSCIEALVGQAVENKVLLIMDGLDEMDKSLPFIKMLMQKRLYPHLTVLATTRPWMIDQLGLVRSAHIDLLLDLQGFSYENSMLFAKKFFDKCCNDESAIEQFKQNISNDFVIASLIHVPLLLLLIVQVWYEKKSFPKTIHELYIEILNIMVDRYISNKNTEQKSNGKQDEKKIVQKPWSLENTEFILTDKLKNLSLVHQLGEGFLAALCEVAYQFLITVAEETSFCFEEKDFMNILDKSMKLGNTDLKFDAKEFSLVFEEKALLDLLGKENGSSKLQTALELGILSKSDSPARRKKVCLIFLHKTVQEFLAAIDICCTEAKFNNFLGVLKRFGNVFQYENIIMFVAGISTSHCEKIFEKIYEVYDKEVDQDRAKINDYDMHKLCRLYRACIKEFCSEPVGLKLHSLHADNEEDWNILHMSYLKTHLRYLKLTRFDLGEALDLSESKCLTVLSLTDTNIKGELFLSECTQLRSLELSRTSLNYDALHLFESNYQNKLWLGDYQFMKCKLLLSECTQLRSLKLTYCCLNDTVLDLSKSSCLEYLSLKYVTMKGKLLLSQCTQLRNLKLVYCSLDEGTLDLSESHCLEYLSLKCVTMNGKLFPSECTQCVFLEQHECSLHDDRLSAFNFVEHLSLQYMIKNGKLFNSESIYLYMDDYSSNDDTWDLSETNHLEYLILQYVTMKGKLLLSQCTRLRCLKLVGCHFFKASTIPLSQYDKPNLKEVTMKSKLFLSKHTQLFHLKLDSCRLVDATLDLSGSNSLEYLSLESVTMKGLFVLKCTSLRSLKLSDCEFDDATFSLLQFNYLNKIIFANVTGRVKLFLSKCTNLRCLKLAHCSLDDATLDLSESNCLEYFSFVCVTMNGSKLFLSECTQLSSLKLSECTLDDTTLDLSESKCLNKVNLVDITLKGNTNVMLCNSIAMCTQLKELSLKNLDLGDALLNLEKLESLDHLTIINVTMCEHGYTMLCNSISKCTKLVHLMLTNLDLGDAIPHMENLTELELVNITISSQYVDHIKASVQRLKSLHRLYFEHKELIIEKSADCSKKWVVNYGNKRDLDDDFDGDDDDDYGFDLDGTDSYYNEDEYDRYYEEEFDIHPVHDFDPYFEEDSLF